MGTLTLSIIIIISIIIIGGFIAFFLVSLIVPRKKENEEEKVRVVRVIEQKSDLQKIEEGIAVLEKRKEQLVKRLVEQKTPEEPTPAEEIEETLTEVLEEDSKEELQDVLAEVLEEEVKKNPRRNRTFEIKISSSSDAVKKYFNSIMNKFREYGVSPRVGKTKVNFKIKKEVYGRFIFKAKKLVLCLPLNPTAPQFDPEIYKQIDYSTKKGYEELAFGMKIANKKSAANALELIDMVAKKFDLERKEKFKEKDYIAQYPDIYSNFEKLGYGWMIQPEVFKENAEQWPDTFAEKILIKQALHEKKPKRVVKEEIRIEEFNNRYTDTSLPVDLVRLQESKLISNKTNYLIVRASARIDKPFTVYAHEFDADAIKMICMAGGQAIQLEFDPEESAE